MMNASLKTILSFPKYSLLRSPVMAHFFDHWWSEVIPLYVPVFLPLYVFVFIHLYMPVFIPLDVSVLILLYVSVLIPL